MVTGTNLNSIAVPIANFSGSENTTVCRMQSSSMRCTYPEFHPVTAVEEQNVTFIMDGISPNLTTRSITVYPNPDFEPFKEKAYSDDFVLAVCAY